MAATCPAEVEQRNTLGLTPYSISCPQLIELAVSVSDSNYYLGCCCAALPLHPEESGFSTGLLILPSVALHISQGDWDTLRGP